MQARWILGGTLGAALGALVWAAVAYTAHFAAGYIACGVGLLTGLGVRTAARGAVGRAPGMTALLLALLGVVAGKYAATQLNLASAFADMPGQVEVSDNAATVRVAHQVIQEHRARRRRVNWPDGVDPHNASKPTDFPGDVWEEAMARWQAKSPAERAAFKQEISDKTRATVDSVKSTLRDQALKESFGPYDALWLLLAAVAAYSLGSGHRSRRHSPQGQAAPQSSAPTGRDSPLAQNAEGLDQNAGETSS